MPEINVPKEFKEFKICGWINFTDGTSELVIRYEKIDLFIEKFVTINGNEYIRKMVKTPEIAEYLDNCPFQCIAVSEEHWLKRTSVFVDDTWEHVCHLIKDYAIVKNEEEKCGFSSIVNFNIAEHIIGDAMKIWGLNVKNVLLEEENKRLLEKNNKLMGDLSEVQKNYNILKSDITSLIDKLEAKKNTEKEKNN